MEEEEEQSSAGGQGWRELPVPRKRQARLEPELRLVQSVAAIQDFAEDLLVDFLEGWLIHLGEEKAH